MIDREARNKTAELVRHMLSGVISFGEFEKALPIESHDPAVKSVICEVWESVQFELCNADVFPDDEETFNAMHFGKDCPLDPGSRLDIARWIVFLYTDHEYTTRSKLSRVLGCSIIYGALLLIVTGNHAWIVLSSVVILTSAYGFYCRLY